MSELERLIKDPVIHEMADSTVLYGYTAFIRERFFIQSACSAYKRMCREIGRIPRHESEGGPARAIRWLLGAVEQ